MNSKRKGDLHRRLSMAPVPRPPADLLDRIKSDIPEYLRPETDRKRLTRSVAFNMRVAASILIVVSSVIGAIYLLGPQEVMQMSPSPAASVAEKKTDAALDEVRVEIAQQAAPPATVQLTDLPTALAATAREADVAEHAITRRKEDRPRNRLSRTRWPSSSRIPHRSWPRFLRPWRRLRHPRHLRLAKR